jgi:hypothetical protein
VGLQRSLADANAKYSAWDDARERRFNAHLDEAEAAADADLDEAIERYAWAVRGVSDRFNQGG